MGSHVTVTQLTSHQHEGLRRSPASSPSPPPTPCSSSRTGPRLPMSPSTEWPDRPPCRWRMTFRSDHQDLPRPPGGGSRRRRTWRLQLMPHMAPRPWVALRSRFTAVPARETMTSHHGATTTPSPLTLLSTIKHNHHHRHHQGLTLTLMMTIYPQTSSNALCHF